MRKIAVYGDSFAKCNSEIALKDVVTWTDLLNNNFILDNYGQSGSSLYYSYCRFIDTHSKYEQIIFISTSAGRLEVFNSDNQIIYISNLQSAEYHLKSLDTINRPYVQAALDYFKYIFNYQKENLIHKLILAEIRKTRPDAFIYKAFPYDKNQFTLSDISKLERSAWECLDGIYDPLLDKRRSHLTQSNHFKVYQHIYQDLTINLKPTELNPTDFEQTFTYTELARFFAKDPAVQI